MATLLFRLAPGAVVPLHEHTGVELTYVLEGSLEDEEGECTAGNFVWRPAGNTHEARAPRGALLLGVFMSPNHFAAGPEVLYRGEPRLACRCAAVGGPLELHGLGVQPGNAGAERVQAAAIALQAFAEAGNHGAQFGQGTLRHAATAARWPATALSSPASARRSRSCPSSVARRLAPRKRDDLRGRGRIGS